MAYIKIDKKEKVGLDMPLAQRRKPASGKPKQSHLNLIMKHVLLFLATRDG